MKKYLAIMYGVRCGYDLDHGFHLRFTAHTSEILSSMQVISGGVEVAEFVRAYAVDDIHDLEGKPVWLSCDDGEPGPGSITKVANPWRSSQ